MITPYFGFFFLFANNKERVIVEAPRMDDCRNCCIDFSWLWTSHFTVEEYLKDA